MPNQTHKSANERKQRLTGVDLFRGLAAYAVVLYHSGDRSWGDLGPGVSELRNAFGFAVPFFLAISFYFLVRKLTKSSSNNFNLIEFYKLRVQRIVAPYLIWTLIYVVLKATLFTVSNQSARLSELFNDPLSVVFFGGASYHLYFLPLLLSGISVAIFFHKIWSNSRMGYLGILFLLPISIFIHTMLLVTMNDFHLGPDIAFSNLFDYSNGSEINPLLRLLLVALAWAIRCFPYVFLAYLYSFWMVENESSLPKTSSGVKAIALSVLILLFVVGTYVKSSLPQLSVLCDLLISYSLISIAILTSSNLFKTRIRSLTENLGYCSLGIYLIHPIILLGIKLIAQPLLPSLMSQVTILSILLISIVGFSLSWLIVHIMLKAQISKYLLRS